MTNKNEMPVVGQKYKYKTKSSNIFPSEEYVVTFRGVNKEGKCKFSFDCYPDEQVSPILLLFPEKIAHKLIAIDEVKVSGVEEAMAEFIVSVSNDFKCALMDLEAFIGKTAKANERIRLVENFKNHLIYLLENLINALEAERKIARLKNDEKEAIFAHPWESKGDSKKYPDTSDKTQPAHGIKDDFEEEKPKSILKDVSELWNRKGFDNKDLILKMEDGSYIFGQGYDKDIRPIGTNSFQYYQLKECCTLTDFINSFEQLQRDVEEIKRKIK